MRSSFARRLCFSYLFVVFITLLFAWFYLGPRLERDFSAQLEQSLAAQASLLADTIGGALAPQAARRSLSLESRVQRIGRRLGLRVTLIRSDGTVLADSERTWEEVARMDNHLHRPEVQAALRAGHGKSLRHSTTLERPMLYVAVPVVAGGAAQAPLGVLRVALPTQIVDERVRGFRRQLLLAGAAALGVAFLVALFSVQRISRPLKMLVRTAQAIGDGKREPLPALDSKDEFGRLAEAFAEMARRIEDQFNEISNKRAELHRLEHIRQEFVANVSHELKTPLTSIKGYAETLLAGAIDDPQHNRPFLEIIQSQSDRLMRLIENLLDFSAIEARRVEYRFQALALPQTVARVVADMQPLAQRKKVTLVSRVPAALPAVRADPEKLTQILVNLIDNAIKFNREGGSVSIDASAQGNEAQISVQDTGPGIDAKDLPRVFERFFRGDRSHSSETVGTGLGLAIVKHLIEVHGGRVSAESAPGQGSTFRMTLPLYS